MVQSPCRLKSWPEYYVRGTCEQCFPDNKSAMIRDYSEPHTAILRLSSSSSEIVAHAATRSSPRAFRRQRSSALSTIVLSIPFTVAQLEFELVCFRKPRVQHSYKQPKLVALRPGRKLDIPLVAEHSHYRMYYLYRYVI